MVTRPTMKLPLPVKVCFNTGALLDIPTGEWIKGSHDQYILNGGPGNITGVIGPGNSFKTTLMRFMEACIISRIFPTVAYDDLAGFSYDTEVNTHVGRVDRLSKAFDNLKDNTLIDDGVWQVTDKSIYTGNEWFDIVKSYLLEKRKDRSAFKYTTAFLDRDRQPMKLMAPTTADVDSLSHFTTSDVEKMINDTELGEAAGNTVYMRQGLAKSRLLLELPALTAGSCAYFFFTAHIGSQILMPSAPGTPPPRKQLGGMNQGEVIKGVTNNFFYLLHNCWLVTSATVFANQGTKAPEYPYEPGAEIAGDQDLMKLKIKQLRGKNGGSNFTLEILVSQKEGVLPGLTEFHYIKEMNRFGLEGSNTSYNLVLCPDINLSRTKVRKAIRENQKLRRALEITSQLCQMTEYMTEWSNIYMSAEDLYKSLQEKGYDWEWLLNNTRGWHTLNDEEAPLYLFTTLDMCRAARGLYTPYWLEADLKTVKPEYAKKKVKTKNG